MPRVILRVMVSEHEELAAYFDRWYADMAGPSVKDEIQQRHLGLPPELLSTSLLTWAAVAEVADGLALHPGELLVDLACGRGGYGLELASRSRARVLGIDFAPSALEAARAQAAARGIDAEYQVGDLVATGLADDAADAVVVLDAIQFPVAPGAAYAEISRILRPGGRVVLTCWEAVDRDDAAVPERLRDVDLRGGLEAAGFVDVEVRERAEWRDAERAMWTEAAALDPGEDPALVSFHEEGVRVLGGFDRVRRMMATAALPC
jgi:SAM-dependent methyltransferase